MHARSLLCLSATLAFAFSSGAAFANPPHGGAHPNPKAHAPAKKNNGHTSPPSAASTHKSGANPNTSPSATAQHPNHKDDAAHHKAEEHRKKEEHRPRDVEDRELRKDIDRLTKLDAELTRALLARQGDHHRTGQNGKGNNPNQQANGQNGQQGYQPSMGSGQQSSGQQGYGSSGEQESGGTQVAQEQGTSGHQPTHHGMAGEALQHVERLLMAAIHQMEEAFTGDEHHRHHHLAEANRLLGEAARCSEMAAHVEHRYEHPRMEAAPNSRRS